MTISELGSLGELIASIAVLVTLVYLSIQIRQANAHARAQTRQRMTEQAQQEVYKGFIDIPSIHQSFTKAELTETEWVQLAGWLLAAMRQREYEWLQMRSGVIDEEIWAAYREVIRIHLGTARTKKWWDEVGRLPFHPEFNEMVDTLLAEEGAIPHFQLFHQLITEPDPGPGLIQATRS